MAVYVGTQEFPGYGEAIDYLRSNPDAVDAGLRITTEPQEQNTNSIETFTFFRGAERGNASPTSLYGSRESEQLTESELREYFEGDTVNRLPEVFGTFDNYLAYMTEREQLIQSGDYDVGNWDEYTGGLTEDEIMILEGEDLTQYGDDASSTYEELYGERTQNQSAAYNNWVNSEANQALLQKYGVKDTVYSSTGDKFRWNGTAYVKTIDEDHAGFADYVKMAMVTALSIYTGGALSTAGLSSTTSAALSQAITQGITTGSIDPEAILRSAATSGLSNALTDFLGDALEGVIPNLDEVLSTGVEEVDAVLSSMALDALRQGIVTGDIDFQQVIQSGAFTAIGEFFEFVNNNRNASAEDIAAYEAKWQEMTEAQHQEMFETIETQFGQGALLDALNQMGAETTELLNQTLASMFESNNISQDDEGTWLQEDTVDTDTPVDSDPETDTSPAVIDNPFEGDELINGVYYNENGFPIGVHPDATPEQILEQFVNDKNTWSTLSGDVHGLPPEAVAVLAQAAGDAQGLSNFLVENNLILAQDADGAYMLISGAEATTGLHRSLNIDEIFELETATENNYLPNPSRDNDLLNPTDDRNISDDVLDILTEIQNDPDILDPDWSIDPTTMEWEDITFEDLTPEEVVELEQIVEDVLSENAEATLEDVLNAAQQSGVTDANALATIAQNIASTSQEIFEALQNSGVTAEEAAAALVNSEQWTAEEANNALSDTSGGYESPTSSTQYQVGDRYFDNINDARAYDYNTSGTIDNVSSYTPVDTDVTDINEEDSLNTSSGVYSSMENSEVARELHALMQRINDGDVGATQEQIDFLISQWEDSTGDMWDDSYLIEDPYEGFEDFDTTDATSEIGGQLTSAEENIVLTILDTAAQTQRELTEAEQNLINALQSGNTETVREILEGVSSGEQSILDVLDGLNINSSDMQEQLTDLSGQLTSAEENIVLQILNNAITTDRALTLTEENLLSSLSSGNTEVVREILNNISSGEQSILDVLDGLNIDVTNVQDQLSNLSGQLTSTEQNIVDQILDSAAASGRELTEAEQRIVDAFESGNTEVVREILDNVSSGEQSILDVLSGLNVNTSDIQNQLTGLSGQLTSTEQNIVDQILNSATASGRELTEAEQRIVDALQSGNTEVVREVLNNVSSGEQSILDVLSGLNVNTTDIRADLANLSSQLTGTEQNIVAQILTSATNSGRELTAAEQRIVDALQSGDNRVVRDVLNGISSGEESILDGLVSLNIDTTGIIDQLSNLSGQLTEAEQSIVAQILNSATTTGRELTESEARLLEALSSGNTGTVRDILNGISTGEQDILTDLGNLNVDVTGIQSSVTNLNTTINLGLEGLSEALGIQTSDLINAIENLGTGLSGNLTGLEGSVLEGLTGLANSLGTDIGTVVGSIEGLGEGIAANVQGLANSLGTDISSGFEGLGIDLGEGFAGLGTDISSGFEGLGGQLGAGFGGLMLGLAGLGELVPTQKDIYAAMPKERLSYTPYQFKGLGYQQRPQQGMLTTPQSPSAMDALNQFIERNKKA